ncbi:MAG: alanyl-tRNA editing protein, partial [Treponema sp.]|nr:alanyl-tRNA editing protein [Treponema sp.]
AVLILDSRRRRDITVQHTGQHLLSGTIFRMTGSNTVSMHLGDETCTIDIDAPEMATDCLLDAENAVADAIEENLPVIIHLCPPEDISALPLRKFPPQGEEVIRVVEIKGIDFSPCCGTHLKSTAEIGMLRILNAEKYKGMTRITFIVGRRVLLDSRLLRQNAAVVSRALSAPIHETGKAVLEFLEKSAHAEMRLKALEAQAAQTKAAALLGKAALLRNAAETQAAEAKPVMVVESYAAEGFDEVLCIGKAAQKEAEKEAAGFVLVLASERDLKFAAFCAAKNVDLRPLVKEALDAHGGRGGGSASFFQGSFGTKEALDAFLFLLR